MNPPCSDGGHSVAVFGEALPAAPYFVLFKQELRRKPIRTAERQLFMTLFLSLLSANSRKSHPSSSGLRRANALFSSITVGNNYGAQTNGAYSVGVERSGITETSVERTP